MIRQLTVVLWACCLLLGACRGSDSNELTVSAAMSLQDAFRELGSQFERRHSGTTVRFNFASSGSLAAQILAGAPVDIFASASQAHMDRLVRQRLVHAESRRDFARNSLVLIQSLRANRRMSRFSDLAKSGSVAMGNPATVPAGRYARQVLVHLGLHKQLQSKLVYAEHVRQVLDYVARQEVDAGLLYATDAFDRQDAVRVVTTAISGSHTPIVYPIAIVRASTKSDVAQKFIHHVLSSDGQRILRKHGFLDVGR